MKQMAVLVTLLLICSAAAVGQGLSLGAGAFAGIDIPVAQDDQAQGATFGIRARVKAIPILTIEPNLRFTSYGKASIAGISPDLDGSKITYFGVDGLLGAPFSAPGLNVFLVGGLGIYKIKRDQTGQDISKSGFDGGLGIAIGVGPKLSVDGRGLLTVVPTDGGGSKKSFVLIAGVNYSFGK